MAGCPAAINDGKQVLLLVPREVTSPVALLALSLMCTSHRMALCPGPPRSLSATRLLPVNFNAPFISRRFVRANRSITVRSIQSAARLSVAPRSFQDAHACVWSRLHAVVLQPLTRSFTLQRTPTASSSLKSTSIADIVVDYSPPPLSRRCRQGQRQPHLKRDARLA